MDYFALRRPKYWLLPDEDATRAAFPQASDFKFEDPSWHPHVVMDPRPTHAAREFILREAKHVEEAQKNAEETARKVVSGVLAESTPEDIAEQIAAFQRAHAIRNEEKIEACGKCTPAKPCRKHVCPVQDPASLKAKLIEIGWACDRKMNLESNKITAVRVAVMAHSIGGDWRCYRCNWTFDKSPDFPPLVDEASLQARLEVIRHMAEEDVDALNLIALRGSEVTEEERKKSAPPSDSSSTGLAISLVCDGTREKSA